MNLLCLIDCVLLASSVAVDSFVSGATIRLDSATVNTFNYNGSFDIAGFSSTDSYFFGDYSTEAKSPSLPSGLSNQGDYHYSGIVSTQSPSLNNNYFIVKISSDTGETKLSFNVDNVSIGGYGVFSFSMFDGYSGTSSTSNSMVFGHFDRNGLVFDSEFTSCTFDYEMGISYYWACCITIIQADSSNDYFRGYQAGKDDGYKKGFDEGKQVGYNEGRLDGGNLDFTNSAFMVLIDTVLQAPFTILKEGLNFDFFGINFASLTMSIITIALVALVVSFLIGKFK